MATPAAHGREPAQSQIAPPAGFRFLARQPILPRDEQVFGYELLFGDGLENHFRATDLEGAARSPPETSLLLGLDVLCDQHQAFINCTLDLLLNDYAFLLPAKQTIIEILESVEPDADGFAVCQRLGDAEYVLALDDFAENDFRATMAELAEIIKVDLKAIASAWCCSCWPVRRPSPYACREG